MLTRNKRCDKHVNKSEDCKEESFLNSKEQFILLLLLGIVWFGPYVQSAVLYAGIDLLVDIVKWVNVLGHIALPVYSVVLFKKILKTPHSDDVKFKEPSFVSELSAPVNWFATYRILLYFFFMLCFSLTVRRSLTTLFPFYSFIAFVLLIICAVGDIFLYINTKSCIARYKEIITSEWYKEWKSTNKILLIIYLILLYIMTMYIRLAII